MIEKGDLGEEGLEAKRLMERVLGVVVLHSSFGFNESMSLLSTFLLETVLQRKRGVEGVLLLAFGVGCFSASAAAALLSRGSVLQNALRQPVPIFLRKRGRERGGGRRIDLKDGRCNSVYKFRIVFILFRE